LGAPRALIFVAEDRFRSAKEEDYDDGSTGGKRNSRGRKEHKVKEKGLT